jgi:glycosyltransferase involved in cell wall biosynthesis
MSQSQTVSLIIVSRKRQTSLRRTISSLRFQNYKDFEVIVVSDAKDAEFLADLPHAKSICHIHFDEPNISAARNIGIVAARGDIIAFCDDDAVPDPCWLERLITPFCEPKVASAGGFVRGRNGIEFQWRALLSDDCGDDHPFDVNDTQPFTIVPYDGLLFAKLQGTNCAFRKVALAEIGGFDERFRFFLDETDVCQRLAQAGYDSAFVPMAQVHHGFAESDQRSEARAPKTLFDLGVSKRLFLNKHADMAHNKASIDVFVKDQRERLVRLMVEGRIEPRDVARLLGTLHQGLNSQHQIQKAPRQKMVEREFIPFGHNPPKEFEFIGGSTLSRHKLLARARTNANKDIPTLVLLLSITTLFHTRDYNIRGFWMQKGGLFGRSNRNDPLFKVNGLRGRVRKEFERTSNIFPSTNLQLIKIFRNFVSEKTINGGS